MIVGGGPSCYGQAPSSPLPTWYTSANPSIGDWVEVFGSSPSVIPLVPYANDNGGNWIDPWCGLCGDTRTGEVIGPAGGGHGDCFENKVTSVNMMDNAPVWAILLDDSDITAIPAQGIAGDNTNEVYVDGRPASCHNYYSPLVIEARNRAIRFGANAVANFSGSHPSVQAFDYVTSNTWDAALTYPDINPNPGSGGGEGWCVCKDDSENVYILNGNTSLVKWTQASNTWSTLGGGFPTVDGFEYASAYDTDLDQILFIRGSSVALYNVGTPGWSTPTLTGTGSAALLALLKGISLDYNATLGVYIARGGAAGRTVYKITPGTWDVTTATVGGGTPPATFTIADTENVYRKFLPAPAAMKGYFFFPSFTANGWFWRSH